MTVALPDPTWLVGCGNMAGAMVQGWGLAGVDFSTATVIRPSGKPVEGIQTQVDLPPGSPSMVLLGFKPQKLDDVAPALQPHVGPDTILVSMLAGASAENLRDRFPEVRAVVRIMPNLPVAQRQGVVAVYAPGIDEDVRSIVDGLMGLLGLTVWCDQEAQFSAIGAIAGAGPAYVARFAAALAKGGEKLGLDEATAAAVAVQTVVGTGALAASTGESMDELARRVASPKGTTEQGLAVLDALDGLQPLVDQMLQAAYRRGQELAAETRRD